MTSQVTSFLSNIFTDEPIGLGKQAYFRERLKGNFHEKLVNLFREKEYSGEITRAKLARKIGKRPEQITRILNASGNLSLNTVSDILLGMGCEPEILIKELREAPRNYASPDWLNSSTPPQSISIGGFNSSSVQTDSSISSSLKVLEPQ